jgi:hypothetical protein
MHVACQCKILYWIAFRLLGEVETRKGTERHRASEALAGRGPLRAVAKVSRVEESEPEKHTANRPGCGSPPIGSYQAPMRFGIKSTRQPGVQRNLHEPCREPIDGHRHEAREQPRLANSARDQSGGCEEFHDHKWSDKQRHPPHVARMIVWKRIASHLRPKRIVNELDRPNETDERPSGRAMKDKERSHRIAGRSSSVPAGHRDCPPAWRTPIATGENAAPRIDL